MAKLDVQGAATFASWFLVRTAPRRESFAEIVLRDWLHCVVYLPQITVERVHRRKLEQVQRPFFPCYAFVADDGRGVRHIKTAPGVATVVGTSDGPARVRPAVIDAIRDQERDGLVQAWTPGQVIRVHGLDAVFKERDGNKRASVMIKLFASEHKVSVPLEQLEAA